MRFISFIFIIFLNLNLFSYYKAILWIPKSEESVKNILEFKKENNLNYVLNIAVPYNFSVEFSTKDVFTVNTLNNFNDINVIYFPKNTDVSSLKYLDNNFDFFTYMFDYEVSKFNENSLKSDTILFPWTVSERRILNLSKAYGYYNFIVKSTDNFNQPVSVDSFTFIPFEIINSTYDFYNSTSNFILLDSMHNISVSTDFLKQIFLDEKNQYVDIKTMLSYSTITYKNSIDDVYNFISDTFIPYSEIIECDEQINFIYFLHNIMQEIINYLMHSSYYTLKGNEILSTYIDMQNYFSVICNADKEKLQDKIRTDTVKLYRLIDKNVPGFVYTDFFTKSEFDKYTVNKTTYSVEFKSLSEKNLVKDFRVNLSTEADTEFRIVFSTINENYVNIDDYKIDIYIDINNREYAGYTKTLSGKEQLYSKYAWEYAFVIKKNKAYLYRSGYRGIDKVAKYRVDKTDSVLMFSIPKSDLNGSFLKWDYILVIYDKDENVIDGIYDVIENGFIYPLTEH